MWHTLPNDSHFLQRKEIEPVKKTIPKICQKPIRQVQDIVECPIPLYNFDFNFYFGHLYETGIMNEEEKEKLQDTNGLKPVKEKLLNVKSAFSSFGNNALTQSTSCLSTFQKDMERNIEDFKGNENFNSQNQCYSLEGNPLMKKNLTPMFTQAIGMSQSSVKKEEKPKITKKFITISAVAKKIKKKPGILFECSGGSQQQAVLKKKRCRKNHDQLQVLDKFLKEKTQWSKDEIKRISREIGLKETKVYKWLWDQRNKKVKNSMFLIQK
ncbi:MAG: homeobox domain-containing protein [archaeon]|nr:homeobox domain-containing protein [archaeon]